LASAAPERPGPAGAADGWRPADPGPLGVAGLTTVVLSMFNSNLVNGKEVPVMLGLAYGGIVQLPCYVGVSDRRYLPTRPSGGPFCR
jgi:succinate-acetate transporter protein